MKLNISAALFLSISCVVSICSAILPGELLASNGNETSDQNKQDGERNANHNNSNLTLTSPGNGPGAKLDLNSTFYYEADTFLLNKSTIQPEAVKQTSGTTRNVASTNGPVVVGSDRRGRMLDLDALVGDLEASRAQKEIRAQITSRQSRNLNPRQHHLDIGGGKRLHIQGFIPIVGVKDDDNEHGEDGGKTNGDEMQLASSQNQLLSQATATTNYGSGMRQQQPKLKMMPTSGGNFEQSSLMKANGPSGMFEMPYGQSSLGHATFNVQRLLNTEPNQMDYSPQMQQMAVAPTFPPGPSQPAKFTAAGIVDTLKRPIQKLTNTFGGSNNNDQHQQKMVQQQQNCLCVPFYMCKNGLISESGLSRAQIQQLIAQQQQQQQSPRQLLAEPSVVSSSFGSLSSLIDERSSERELITTTTMASSTETPASGSTSSMMMNNLEPEPSSLDMQQPVGIPPDGAQNQNQKPTDQSNNQQASSSSSAGLDPNNFDSQISANSSLNPANFLSPDEMTTLNQATSDYSQDILGRMLGLKASNSRVAMLGSASQTQAGNNQQQHQTNGVCGIWRTCCSIPANLLTSSPPMSDGPNRQVAALQRYQQPVVLPTRSTQQLAISPVNSGQLGGGYEPAMSNLQTSSLYQQSLPQQQQQLRRFGPNLAASISVQQYARAPPAQQTLQSFQAPPGSSQQQLRQQFTQMASQNQRLSQQQPSVQLGTRKLLEGRCGLRQSAGINGRVQNSSPGSENSADFGEYPAQAAILKRLNGTESLFVCSGTLISQSWVATAAHCIRKHLTPSSGGAGGSGGVQHLRVRLGEWDVHRDDEFYPHVEKDVRDLIIHPDFIPSNLINDIALIRLESPIDSTLPHVMPACLPAQDETFSRQRCWVAGWGKDAFGQSGSFQSTLQEVELPVWSHSECEQALKQTRLGPHYRLHPGFVCAGGEQGKDACEGDGGSGLYCSHEGGAIKVAGLVSWGISCGQRNVPGVFVSMPHYRSWIENIISIDEDIYSSYNPLPVNGLISERNAGAAAPDVAKTNSSQTTVDELKVGGNANERAAATS